MPATGRVAQLVGQRPVGLQLFASSQDEPRARRPTDIALAIVSTLVIIAAATLFGFSEDFEDGLSDILSSLPGLFDPLWTLALWMALAWAAVLLATSVIRRRRPLARDLVAAGLMAIVIAAIVAALAGDDARSVVDVLVDVDGPPAFPPGWLTLSTAVISTASPHMARPFRHLGRWLVAAQLFGVLFIGAAVVSGAVAAVAVGTLAAALVHLAVGSPGGRPTVSRILLALADLGVEAHDLEPASMHHAGVVRFEGRDDEGELLVKVYGRDAWDAQLLATVWRALWYRGSERTPRLSRIDLVEHEGFVTLLAARAGVNVPHLVTAGTAGRGDAIVVVRPIGTALEVTTKGAETGTDAPAWDASTIDALWQQVDRLHDAGISHRHIDLDRVVLTPTGAIGFGDLASASVVDDPSDVLKDHAQVLALSISLAGEDAAVAAARRALGDDGVLAMLPYLQEAAVPPIVHDALGDLEIELDDVRRRAGETLGAKDQPLIKLRRVTWGSVLNLALLGIAAYTMIALLGDVDLQSFVEALQDANWWWLAFALVFAQVPRIPSAVSTMGSTQHPLPLGPLTTLQFAICYVNLAIPSSAARVAINIRFFQRCGIGPTGAISAGAIDSVAGFVVQIVLFLLLFFASDIDFGVSTDPGDLSGLATIALIVIVAVVVLGIVVLAVPTLRARAMKVWRDAREALRVLRSPIKLLQLFGGNLVAQVLFAVAFGACTQAFGADVPLTELVLINTVVSLFAGLLPIPGGIGVSEAGLTYGLTAAGVPTETAFAAAIAYRFASFYLPPIWGWFCYRWLIRQRYL